MDTIRTLVSAGTVVGCILAFTLATVADDLAPTADNSGVLTADGEQQLWSSARPDGHAPIGVMGDHTHSRGEWMASVRYMYMFMNGNQGRGGNKSTSDVLDDYPVAPKDMTTNMVMFGMMNAPTDDLTFMVMVPYIFKEMSHRKLFRRRMAHQRQDLARRHFKEAGFIGLHVGDAGRDGEQAPVVALRIRAPDQVLPAAAVLIAGIDRQEDIAGL